MPKRLTHVDSRGRVRMVDVGAKPPVRRTAAAEGYFCAAPATLDRLWAGDLPKGEALAAARLAGILAAKKCDQLVPLCHTLPLEAVHLDFERDDPGRLRIMATVSITAKTGVEMEALLAVSVAALTLWDMTKAVDSRLRIEGIRLIHKRKGQPGRRRSAR
jgi:cyclic pyranopterin phosphate synthase